MKDDRVYLAHIRDAIARILNYTSQGKTYFDQDEKTQDAVVRNLEVIGEAVKNVSSSPWRGISAATSFGVAVLAVSGGRSPSNHHPARVCFATGCTCARASPVLGMLFPSTRPHTSQRVPGGVWK